MYLMQSSSLSLQDRAAEMHGLKVRRNNMVSRPFHNDRTPSMKVDKRFHCFGCGADGDVIDFVSRLLWHLQSGSSTKDSFRLWNIL